MKLFALGLHRPYTVQRGDTVGKDTVGKDLDIVFALMELKSLVGETDARQMQTKSIVT